MRISMGCDKMISVSFKPTIFIIEEVTQDAQDKKAHVAEYLIREFETQSDGSHNIIKVEWYALQEGFEVGDTIKFTK